MLLSDDTTAYSEKPKESTGNLLELIVNQAWLTDIWWVHVCLFSHKKWENEEILKYYFYNVGKSAQNLYTKKIIK